MIFISSPDSRNWDMGVYIKVQVKLYLVSYFLTNLNERQNKHTDVVCRLHVMDRQHVVSGTEQQWC